VRGAKGSQKSTPRSRDPGRSGKGARAGGQEHRGKGKQMEVERARIEEEKRAGTAQEPGGKPSARNGEDARNTQGAGTPTRRKEDEGIRAGQAHEKRKPGEEAEEQSTSRKRRRR